MNIHPFFKEIVCSIEDAPEVVQVLQELYNDYVSEIEYFVNNGFKTDPILSPESWFESVLNDTL